MARLLSDSSDRFVVPHLAKVKMTWSRLPFYWPLSRKKD
jgi:hypothetical protein